MALLFWGDCMRKNNIVSISIYIIIFFLIVASIIFGFKNINLNRIVQIIIVLVSIFTFILKRKEHLVKENNFNNAKDILYDVLIIMLIYFLSGIIFGYTKNIYNYTFINILKEIIRLFLLSISIEYLRFYLSRHTNNKNVFIALIVLLFSLLEINYVSIIKSISNNREVFILIFTTLIPIVVKNYVLTSIVNAHGFYSSFTYSYTYMLIIYLLPILPNYNLFLSSIIYSFIHIIIFGMIKNKNIIQAKYHKKIYLQDILYFSLLLILLLFNFKLLPIKPNVIVSNSMVPTFKRGDLIIYVSPKNFENIKKNDVIVFNNNNKIYSHRVKRIIKYNNKISFVTKGDANGSVDNFLIKEKDILGKYIIRIPFIGYPSVFFNELFE